MVAIPFADNRAPLLARQSGPIGGTGTDEGHMYTAMYELDEVPRCGLAGTVPDGRNAHRHVHV